MSEAEIGARLKLEEIGRELEALRERLRGVAAGLPQPAEDREAEGRAGLRDLIDCILLDQIDPAIRDLRAAAEWHAS
jgi:hypothetical protein